MRSWASQEAQPLNNSNNLTEPIVLVIADPILDLFSHLIPGHQFPTSAGNLQIDNIDTDADIIFTATVPEPSTWARMALGFSGLCSRHWRGSRKATA